MIETMTLVTFGLSVLMTSVCVVSAWVAADKASKPPSAELQGYVDELGQAVEKLLKTARKERMSRVRNGEADTDHQGNRVDPAGSVPVGNAGSDKTALRQIARAKGVIR